MKFKILIALLCIAQSSFCQELPTNPKTGMISLNDSIEVIGKSQQEIKDLLSKWSYTLFDKSNIERVFKLSNSKQVENIVFNLVIGYPHTIEKGNDKFLNNGTFTYTKAKESKLFSGASVSPANGVVKFSLQYSISRSKIVYEITNIEFSNTGVYYGKFEDEKPPKDNKGIMSLNKKMWQDVKAEHFERIKILSSNLKEYLQNYNISNSPSGQVNYEAYQKIKNGMTLNEVKEILGSEGRELSNSSSQVDGKTVIQQTIVWYESESNKSKFITITFSNEKVISKTQTNL